MKKFFYEQGEENKREEREKENYIKEKGKVEKKRSLYNISCLEHPQNGKDGISKFLIA